MSLARLKVMNGEVDVVGSEHARKLRIWADTEVVAGDVVRVLMPKSAEKAAALKSDRSLLEGTTGTLIIARTKEAAVRLSEYLRPGSAMISKTYLALLVRPPVKPQGLIRTGIVESGAMGKEKMKAVEWLEQDKGTTVPVDGQSVKLAETFFKTISSDSFLALVELKPKTGRKHQLRVHCAQVLQAPILGDYKYGPGMTAQLRNAFKSEKVAKLSLHLREIKIKDWHGPGKDLAVSAPLPSHMYLPLATRNDKRTVQILAEAEAVAAPPPTSQLLQQQQQQQQQQQKLPETTTAAAVDTVDATAAEQPAPQRELRADDSSDHREEGAGGVGSASGAAAPAEA
ncbi:Mitochondrial RNA pseudouridine synthase rpusd4 [Cladochytrium tenue]|nr:Mitochondrial RNA pseudouridine synthase rpusd4 [Cladochytrium tenue]